jgi:hypothetical protein
VVWILGGSLYSLVIRPQTKKATVLFSSGNSAEGGRVVSRIGTFGTIDTLLIVFAVLAMVSKWGA